MQLAAPVMSGAAPPAAHRLTLTQTRHGAAAPAPVAHTPVLMRAFSRQRSGNAMDSLAAAVAAPPKRRRRRHAARNVTHLLSSSALTAIRTQDLRQRRREPKQNALK